MATRIIIAVLGMVLAIWLGFLAGDGSVVLISGIILLLLVFLCKFSIARKLSLEAMLCFFLLMGLLIGQKGFTYLHLTSFLFVSEIFFAVLVIIYIVNTIIHHRPFIPDTWLAKVILLFLLYCTLHLYLDYIKYQFMALRDAPLAYYTFFFILSYRISHQRAILRVLEKWLPSVFLIAALGYAFYNVIPGLRDYLDAIQIGEIRFMLANDVSMNAAFGALFYFYGRFVKANQVTPWVWIGILLSCFAILAAVRGTMVVTTIVSLGLLMRFYQKNIIRHALIFGGVVIVVIATMVIISFPNTDQNLPAPIRGVVEELNAMQFGFNQSNKVETTADTTAQWRMLWWKFLIEDTMAHSPFTGGGFGMDIATPFLMTYHGVHVPAEEWERVRGAHSALLTIFARLGLIGVFFFVLIMGSIARRVWVSLHLLKQGRLPLWYLTIIGYIVGGFVVSFFQYTWEAPYTAIPFWMMVGVLYSGTDKILRSDAGKKQAMAPASVRPIYGRKHQDAISVVSAKFQPVPLSPEKLANRRQRQIQRKFKKEA